MNILYLINYAGKGGSEKYVKLLAKNFMEKGNKIFFVYNKYGELTKYMEKLNVPIFTLNMKFLFDIKAALNLARICKDNNINIIHTQFLRENYIALLTKTFFCKNIEVIHTAHLNLYNNIFLKISNKILTRKNKYIIAVCNSVKNLLIKNNYPKEKIKVIFNGVYYNKNLIDNKKYIKEEFNIDNDTFVFISITRFSKEKGIFYLLKSIKKLLTITEYKFKLILVGDGYLLEKAKKYVYNNNLESYIIFTGYRKDVENFIIESDVFINSSKSEALSFAILEALSKEKPVIVTNVGGNVDIIDKNSKCGKLVEYNNIDDMAKSMKNILENKNLYEFMKESTEEIIKTKFNLDNILLETYKLYLK